MNILQWTKAEILHFAWKRGRYTPPDRKTLESKILPAVASDAAIGDVLFVGVQWYTTKYWPLFAGKRFATLDFAPHLAQFGATDHVVGDVCELGKHYGDRRFDAILLNGVIGYGLNTKEGVDRALTACADQLSPGGLLVIGVNEEKPSHVDPSAVPAGARFEPAPYGELPARVVLEVPFREKTHTFLFWRTR